MSDAAKSWVFQEVRWAGDDNPLGLPFSEAIKAVGPDKTEVSGLPDLAVRLSDLHQLADDAVAAGGCEGTAHAYIAAALRLIWDLGYPDSVFLTPSPYPWQMETFGEADDRSPEFALLHLDLATALVFAGSDGPAGAIAAVHRSIARVCLAARSVGVDPAESLKAALGREDVA